MYVQTIACVRKCKTPRKPLHFIKPYIERRRTRRDSLRSAGGSAEMHVIGTGANAAASLAVSPRLDEPSSHISRSKLGGNHRESS